MRGRAAVAAVSIGACAAGMGCPSTDALVGGRPSDDAGSSFDAEGGAPPSVCGDSKRSADEVCDGSDLGGATCATAVAAGWVGKLVCTPTCSFETKECTTPETIYNALDGPFWNFFDLATFDVDARGYRGAAFDGQRVYFTPYDNNRAQGLVAQYDILGGFTTAGSWARFDTTSVKAGAKGFVGAAFDGRSVLFVPANEGGMAHGITARFDTQTSFGGSGSWSTFDVASIETAAKGFAGAAFDGRHVYLVPNKNGTIGHGHVMRYEKGADVTNASSWTPFDLTTVDPRAKGYSGAAFDGRYVYLVPDENESGMHGLVARYDTTATFRALDSWRVFDAAGQVNASAKGFAGAAFDGEYVYFVPAAGAVVLRHRASGGFMDPVAWTPFDLAGVDARAKGFRGAAFDGRYVYLVPYVNGGAHGFLVRYDTKADFATPASWSTFDLTSRNVAAKGFYGSAFDGRYLYLVPYSGTVAARFDAKGPSWLPRHWNASFF